MTQPETGTYDVSYNLVSVLYHTLQEASTIQQYIDDARYGGDDDAARFLEKIQEEDQNRADQAKELLGRQLSAKA